MLKKKGLLDCSSSVQSSLKKSCNVFGNTFRSLRPFCGELATLMANTATVEGDLFITNYEKNGSCRNLSILSLVGIMHSKQ